MGGGGVGRSPMSFAAECREAPVNLSFRRPRAATDSAVQSAPWRTEPL